MMFLRKDLPSKRNKKKNYFNPKRYNEFLEKMRDGDRNSDGLPKLPFLDIFRQRMTNFDNVRQNTTETDKKLQKINGETLQLILKIQLAVLKYIKDNA